jgi:tetratricopeptide (TPR) repeat protein
MKNSDANPRTRQIIAAISIIAMLIIGIATIVWLTRSPARRQVAVPLPTAAAPASNDGWKRAYGQVMARIGSMDEMTRARQQFVDQYPRSPGTRIVLFQLMSMYAQQGKLAEAKRATELGNQSFPDDSIMPVSLGIYHVNTADNLRRAGKSQQAEAILKQVIARPLPKEPDIQTWVPQLFVAPLALAEIWQSTGKTAEADAMNRSVADKVVELNKLHPDEQWIPGYAGQAYYQRIRALLAGGSTAAQPARALAEEFHQRVPTYSGPFDYQQMIDEITATPLAAKAN